MPLYEQRVSECQKSYSCRISRAAGVRCFDILITRPIRKHACKDRPSAKSTVVTHDDLAMFSLMIKY